MAEQKRLDPTKRSPRVLKFEAGLLSKVIGQDEGVRTLVDVYQTYVAGMTMPKRTVGNILLLGPTGSGKTRLWEAAAETLFGNPNAFLKVNCAEFQHGHEIAKLVGSPPGYLGHRETHPYFKQENLNQWHTEKIKLTLILFDEIEKASDSLWKLMLGIMDKAEMTTGDNQRVNFERCIIGMTSNLGAAEMSALHDGGSGFKYDVESRELDARIDETAKKAAAKKFSPEFMNRIDKVVVFHLLSNEQLRRILEIELGAVQQRILMATGKNQFVFTCRTAAKEALLADGFDPKYGARHLKRSIERNLVFPLTALVSSGQVKFGDLVVVDYIDGKFEFFLDPQAGMGAVLNSAIPFQKGQENES